MDIEGLTVIDFRYHLVSIVAVFLALAIGIVLGSTELQGPAYNFLNQTTSKLQSELDQVTNQRDAAQQEATEGEMYAEAVAPAVLHNLLTGHRLLIVTEPGGMSEPIARLPESVMLGVPYVIVGADRPLKAGVLGVTLICTLAVTVL